ncbi:protein of unknown function [Pseudomonas mediterranea]
MIDLRGHRFAIAMTQEGVGIGPADRHQMDAQVLQFLDEWLVEAEIECPAVGKDSVDPALEQRWHRPPINGIDQYQRIGTLDSSLLGQYVWRWRSFAAMDCVVGDTEARVEAFGGQIGYLEGMAGIGMGQALAYFFGKAMGQGTWVVMSDNDECVHGETPTGNNGGEAAMLG